MDALRAAVPFARLLLVLADHQRTAEVKLRLRGKPVRLSVDAGSLIGIEGVDVESLGDTLLRSGSLDAQRHRAAVVLGATPPQGKVGAWLVAVGAASRSDVQRALRAQLKTRLTYLLRHVDEQADVTARDVAPALKEPETRLSLHWLVFHGLRELAQRLPERELEELAGRGPLKTTRSGSRLLSALRTSADSDEDPAAWLSDSKSAEERKARAVLRVLGAAVDVQFDGDAFRLLLRKQREIRRRVGARALLDLPPYARSEQARPALRKLATKLHPDRFFGQDPALFAASHEVMRALSQAAGELREGYARVR